MTVKSSPKIEIQSHTGLPQETRKISNEQSNFRLSKLEKENPAKPCRGPLFVVSEIAALQEQALKGASKSPWKTR